MMPAREARRWDLLDKGGRLLGKDPEWGVQEEAAVLEHYLHRQGSSAPSGRVCGSCSLSTVNCLF
jgi:hypothetical protein